MLFKTLLLLLVAACSAEDDQDDLNNLILSLFPPLSTTPKQTETSSSSNVTKCTTDDGKPGECVAYYLCNENRTIITDRVLGTRFRRSIDNSCPSVLEICCVMGDNHPPIDSAKQKNDYLIQPVTQKYDDPKPLGGDCGRRNPNGLNGTLGGDSQTAMFAEFPWMCAILKLTSINIYLGGGALIHPSVVLTAAHIALSTELPLGVRAGEWAANSVKEPYPHQDRKISSKEIHKDFNIDTLHYDIAVLFLVKPMDLAPNVQPACLPLPRDVALHGTRCFATGWGKDELGVTGRYQVILKKREVPVAEQSSCQESLRKTQQGRFYQLHSSFMCAGGEGGYNMCLGDGGSPLSCPIQDAPDRFYLSGIVSWGVDCGKNTPDVYANVANLRNWIDEKVTEKGYDPMVYQY